MVHAAATYCSAFHPYGTRKFGDIICTNIIIIIITILTKIINAHFHLHIPLLQVALMSVRMQQMEISAIRGGQMTLQISICFLGTFPKCSGWKFEKSLL